MTSFDDQGYSELKTVTNQRCDHDPSVPESSEIQVMSDNEKQVNYDKTGLKVVANHQHSNFDSDLYPASLRNENHQSQPSRRKWLIFDEISVLLMMIAAILGGVLGSRINDKSSSASFSFLSFSSPSSPSSPSSFLSSSSSSSSSFSSSLSDANVLFQPQRKLAAVSFLRDSIDHTRLYYQDNAGEIVEAARSTKDIRWMNTKLGFFTKNGSAIGAAFSQPSFEDISFNSLPDHTEPHLCAGNHCSIY